MNGEIIVILKQRLNAVKRPSVSLFCATALLAFSVVYSLGVLINVPKQDTAAKTASVVVTQVSGSNKTLPKGFSLQEPRGLTWQRAVFTKDKLYRGLLLLIDEQHPVPSTMPAPNSYSIAAYGKANVATRSAQTVTNMETLQALIPLFQAGRQKGFGEWTVFAGTRSNEQQLDLQLEQLSIFAKSYSLQTAAAMAAKGYERPGCSEHQTGYAVDIRLCDGYNAPPDAKSLSQSSSGKYLLQIAWQHGFIQRYTVKNPHPMEDEDYHFRYVGKNHAELIHLLNMTFEEYLTFLREKGLVCYYEGETLKYVVICGLADGDFMTRVPNEAVDMEASADNTGYAVILYTFN